MKLRLSQLRQIIKEEVTRALHEDGLGDDSAELGIADDQLFVPASPGDMSVGLLSVLKKRLGAGPYMVNNPDNFDAFDALDAALPYNPAQRRSLGVEGDFYQVGSFGGKPVVRQDVDGGQETFFYTVG